MQEMYLHTGELLLPSPQVNPTAWACVACDQFTSQPEYWREADALVGAQRVGDCQARCIITCSINTLTGA